MYVAMYLHSELDQQLLSTDKGAADTMARKKISTTIYITPEQNESLKLLHERTKVPVAVYIREGIDLVLERHSNELPGQLSLATASEGKKK